jgi:cytochrome P450
MAHTYLRIPGIVVLDVDFNAQDPTANAKASQGSIILHEFRGMLSFYDNDNPYVRYNIFQRRRRRLQGERIDTSIRQVIRQKFVEMKESQKSSGAVTKGKSVLLLSLQDLDHLTPEIETQTADQVKTFLLAGHDTTAILLQWALYMLSIHPPILAKLKDELDSVLGPEDGPSGADPAAVLLERGDAVLSKLTYLSAVVKEILRLYPPAGSARMAAPGSGCIVRLDDGSDICVDGMVLYLCHYGIHRDTKIFGDDADAFRPERWLGDVDTSMNTNDDGADAAAHSASPAEKSAETKIPASSWRPFERGPRNCIGQELANLEARVILACTVRRYVFEKVGAGQRFVDGELVGEELINVSGFPLFMGFTNGICLIWIMSEMLT